MVNRARSQNVFIRYRIADLGSKIGASAETL